jgi:hypothetical protein
VAIPGDGGGDGTNQRPLLRSIIDLGDGSISPENLQANFANLAASGLSWDRPDDQRIFHWVSNYYGEHAEAPTYATMLQVFPAYDGINHATFETDEINCRLRVLAEPVTPWFIRTNYKFLITKCLAEQRQIRVIGSLKHAYAIMGKGVDGKQGTDDALAFLESELARHKAQAAASNVIPTLSTSEIFAPLPPIPWQCEGLRISPVGGAVMFAGYGWSGKSMVAQAYLLSVASGLPFLGVHPVKQGKALHLDYEQGNHVTRERYLRLARGMGVDLAKLIEEDRLRLAVFPDLKLDEAKAEAIMAATIKGFDVCLVDSNKASSPSTEENSSDARVPLDMLSKVSGDFCVPINIHHARKPTRDAAGGARTMIRGSGALFDALTGCFVFEGGEERGSPITISHEKERLRGHTIPPFTFRVVDVPGEGDPMWGLRVEIMTQEQLDAVAATSQARILRCTRVLSAIAKHENINARDLRDAVHGIGAEEIKSITFHLRDTGHIEVTNGPRGSKLHRALRDAYEPPTANPAAVGIEEVNGINHDALLEAAGL